MKTMSLVWLVIATSLVGCAGNPVAGDPTSGARRESCKPTSEREIAALFDRWNASLQTGDPRRVADNYAEPSILLPTQSYAVRVTRAEKEAYFTDFLRKRPFGTIGDPRQIEIGCNRAVDSGLYSFRFSPTDEVILARYTYAYRWTGKEWLITSHHSSVLP